MRALIVEDELIIAQRLERLLRTEADDTFNSIDHCPTFAEAEKWLSEQPVDVLFLDLNLNGLDGFALLRDITANAFHTVVVSAHTERAIEAFELGVLDFIGKPFGAERVKKTVDRLLGARGQHPAARLAVRSAGRTDLIPIETVAYVKAAGSYSELVLRNNNVRIHSKSLDRLLPLLPDNFERVHRSYIVRIDEVTQIRVQEGSKYTAVLSSGTEIPIGRTRVAAIRDRLGI